jgi:hypothetical protein
MNIQNIQELYDEIITEKESQTTLAELDSPSTVSIWRGWIYVFAVIINYFEQFLASFYLEIDSKIKTAIAGTEEWYALKAKEFQYGDPLQIINGQPSYALIDESKKIIKAASVSTDRETGISTLKVAKLIGEDFEKLSDSESIAFLAYLDKFGFAGSKVIGRSLPADLIRIFTQVQFNALYDLSELKVKVENAVKVYLKTIPFNGIIRVFDIMNAIKKVEGVVDVVVPIITLKPDGGVFTTVSTSSLTNSGYAKIDPSNPLSTSLTYISV